MRIQEQKKNQKAIALVTVLLLIALLSILVISYFASMRIERRSSMSYADTQRAKMVAQGAVAHAIETLRTNIPDPAGIDKSPATATARNWVINPGRLTVFDENGTEKIVPLHTGKVSKVPDTEMDPDIYSVDLNEPVPGKEEPSICYALDENGEAIESVPVMRVNWINVLSDPSQPASEENPVVARHAFWIDDECNKLNFNTALGKPAPGEDTRFEKQLELGMMPALFRYTTGQANRHWALGKLRSVNLDVLFDNPSDLDKGDLLAHAFYRGHSRHPESILSHLNLDETGKMKWWHRNRYQLTSYSRSPEFNVFGRPRFMTTNIPLSLEGGPYYQLPFVYNGPGAPDTLQNLKGVLHLNSLMGSLGFTHGINDGDGNGRVVAANIVNRAQAEMLMRYFRRTFPGYSGSFVDKYGELECAQMALNILNMARFLTTTMGGEREQPHTQSPPTRNRDRRSYTNAMGWRSTSVLYAPHQRERPGHNPERLYWRYEPDKGFLARGEASGENTVPMIPAVPGPHITEVRMIFQPEKVILTSPTMEKLSFVKIGFRFEVEYYLHPMSPEIETAAFPFKVDYLKVQLNDGNLYTLKMGTDNPAEANESRRWDRNWNYERRRGRNILDENAEPIPRLDNEGNPMFNANGDPLYQRESHMRWRCLGSLKVRAPRIPNDSGQLNQNDPPDPPIILKSHDRALVRGPLNFFHLKWDNVFDTRAPDNIPRQSRWLASRSGDEYPERKTLLFNYEGYSDAELMSVGLEREKDVLNVDATTLKLKVNLRGGMGVEHAAGRPRQMIPLGEDIEDTLESEDITFEIDPQFPVSMSWEIADPQLSAHKDQWTYSSSQDDQAGTPGAPHPEEPAEDSTEKSKFRYLQRGPGRIDGETLNRPDEYDSRSRVSSKGFWSVLPTGIQNKEPYRTLRLSPADPDEPAGPPDWVLMDLLGNTYPLQHNQWRVNSTLPDEFSTVSYMHSTAGAVNLNTKTFPDDSEHFQAPQRRKPIEGVFKHLRSDADIKKILDGIGEFQESDRFKYVGELSDIDGYLRGSGETQFRNEELLRNMIGCLTTRSNTFGVWGVGQVVQKVRENEEWGEFEDGDWVRGEKRFFALVERYVWPGKDGVPGNAHVDEATGKWDRIAKQRQTVEEIQQSADDRDRTIGSFTDRLFGLPGSPPTRVPKNGGRLGLDLHEDPTLNGTYPEYDGPQAVEMDRYAARSLGKVEWRESTLEEAYNPPQAVIKYKVVYFKYLDE